MVCYPRRIFLRNSSKRYDALRVYKQPKAHFRAKRSQLATYVDPDQYYYAEQLGLRYHPADPLNFPDGRSRRRRITSAWRIFTYRKNG